MTSNVRLLAIVALAVAAAGCASLAPPVPVADTAIPAAWPTTPVAQPAGVPAQPADLGWRDFFADPALNALIARALQNNRDLRAAVLTVERARALYRIQRADQFPTVGGSFGMLKSGGANVAAARDEYSVTLGLTDYELDLFGRVRDLSRAALERYFAQAETTRAAQLTLVSEVAYAWFTLAADRELEKVARATLETQEATFRITEQRHERGAVSGLEVAQVRTTVESARSDLARYAGQVARDVNALNLLVGETIEPAALPQDFGTSTLQMATLPPGLPSEVLLQRPDVLAAERRLLAANADIGAARAAFFPSIRLTGALGTSSDALSALFGSGTSFWSFAPQVRVPIFEGGGCRPTSMPRALSRTSRWRSTSAPCRRHSARRPTRLRSQGPSPTSSRRSRRSSTPRRARTPCPTRVSWPAATAISWRSTRSARCLRRSSRSSPRDLPSRRTGWRSTRRSAAACAR
uniref:Putative outer membrane transport protein involved toxic tolerance n=1 Tax=uncultured bacterium fosmid pJB190D12_contig II TaxID=1478060 RepID=A0A0H3U768_9BACT|nr:putative outer membrane transport protein involved toxic tolerance [uncultured bacterium fosmid pJB190D12_contig II]